MRIVYGAVSALAIALAAPVQAQPQGHATRPSAAKTALAWAHQASDVPADASVRYGVLPNGMRYAIRKNATPPGEASLRLRIDAGSLNEAENQRGVAHFLEHMVFNGTRNVPEGEFVRRLERAGLKFGPDTNASTSFDETIYMLDLPETDAATVDTALFLLREVADAASLEAGAIDRERGIILSEERTRATPAYRVAIDELSYLYKGDLLPDRIPIGSTDVISRAPRERFVEFYEAYYRPERATLIAVGDFDVDAMEAKIRSQFSTWRGSGKAGADAPLPTAPNRALESRVKVEAGAPSRVSLSWIGPSDTRADTKARRRERLVESLGLAVLNRRLGLLAASPTPPFIGGGAVRSDPADRAEALQVVAVTQPGKWKEGLSAIEQEQRRLVQYGVAQAELDREISEIRARLKGSVAGAATRASAALAQGLVSAVGEDNVFTDPATGLALFEETVANLRAEQVSAATARLFSRGGPLLYLTSPTPVEGAETALTAGYRESLARAVTAPTVRQAMRWPYESFGTPGKVAERREIEGTGATAIRFANGVRLTVKPTSFKTNEVLVSVRLGDGLLSIPTDRSSPAWGINSGGFTGGGLGKLGAEQLEQALAGTVYSVNAGVGEDAFSLAGRTRKEDFERQMQVLAAFVKEPGWRATGWNRNRAFSGTMHDQWETSPAGVFGREAGVLLRSGDRRWATPSREEMAASSIEDARRLLAPALAGGPLEVIIVGDVTVDEAISRTAATFGALPARQASSVPAAARQVRFPAPGLERRTHKGRADQGLAFIAWPTSDFYADPRGSRALNVLAQVLNLRLIDEIREKQGTTYSPSAGHSPSDVFQGYGYLAANIQAPPEKLEGFFGDATKIAQDLRDRPVTADELQRARQPLIENLQRQRAGNEWWLSQLAGAQERPERVQSIRESLEQYQSLTPADLQAAARRYLADGKTWRMMVLPEAKPAGAAQ
jgi:zinc protease